MKKLVYLAVILSTVFLTSCVVSKKVVPMVSNTVNTVDFDELNLERNDYTILKNVTAEAVIAYKGPTTNDNRRYISEQNGEFSIAFIYTGQRLDPFHVYKIEGVLRFGYLSNDHENMSLSLDPEYYSRHIAFYRLINQCRTAGGDALIAPVVDTSIEQQGDNTIYKTTVTAKVVKINTDK